MKKTLLMILLLNSFTAFAGTGVVEHKDCSVALTSGHYFTLSSYYTLPFDEMEKELVKKLEMKGYKVTKSNVYPDDSDFGDTIEDDHTLSLEFRISCDQYASSEGHKCQASALIMSPFNKKTLSILDADGNILNTIVMYPPIYNNELRTSLSKLTPVLRQRQSVFNQIVKELPSCHVKE